MADILVVEDEIVLARSVVSYLERRGFSAAFAVDARSAATLFLRDAPRLVILDLRLGEDSGLDLLSWMRKTNAETQIVVMTGHGDIDIAVQAMKRGARDFLGKPAPLAAIAAIAAEIIVEDQARGRSLHGIDRIVGRSPATVELRTALKKLAEAAMGEAPPGVLITGPRGSGKTLAASALCEAARPHTGEPLIVDCSLLATPLADQLATARDTAILRNVDVLSDADQAVLTAWLTGHPALFAVATTSANLAALAQEGAFRSDLYYRLQVGWVELLPLLGRAADVLPLAEAFLRQIAARGARSRLWLAAEARAKLLEHDWPGNVAELENCIERAALTCSENEIRASDIRFPGLETTEATVPNLVKLEVTALSNALRIAGGNVSRAAQLLGISRDTLRYRMEKFGLSRR